MAVFRVERNKGYTVMSNHHLRNKELSLKAKGLLSQMLSLPEDWDYTLKGLSLINREKIDAMGLFSLLFFFCYIQKFLLNRTRLPPTVPSTMPCGCYLRSVGNCSVRKVRKFLR